MAARSFIDELNNASENPLYLLLWNDTIERLDTLILEVRHLQQNIIYLLKTPDLTESLRAEEDKIWFQTAAQQELCDDIEKRDPGELAQEWIPSFKSKGKLSSNKMKNGEWSTEQKAHYHNLRVLQGLKRNIVKDKILLCRKAFRCIATDLNTDKSEHLAQFVLFRTAVISKTKVYIDRLCDQQTLFSHHFDFAPVHHPHPAINRRRGQHLYSVHLNEQCRDLYRELFSYLNIIEGTPKSEAKTVPIFHRWQQSSDSHSFSYFNEVVPVPEAKDKSAGESNYLMHNINSSYWMPDRPDIQGVIAHEVAHAVVREHYGDLAWQQLDKRKDPFSRVVKLLKKCIDTFEADAFISWKEIVVDILAATVRGPSFLYALFLELLGLDLDEGFYTDINDTTRMNLELINNLELFESQLNASNKNHESYYRLKIVCAWLRMMGPSSPLEEKLIDSCEDLVENLYDYVHEKSPLPASHSLGYWKAITTELCTTIEKSSLLRKRTREWRKGNGESIERVAPLAEQVRILSVSSFERQLGSDQSTHTDLFGLEERSSSLFECIHDISWQSSLINAVKLQESSLSPKQAIERFYGPSLYIRRIYDIALEFHLYNTEAEGRLASRCVEALKNVKDAELRSSSENIIKSLGDNRNEGGREGYRAKLTEELKNLKAQLKTIIEAKDNTSENLIYENGFESLYDLLMIALDKDENGFRTTGMLETLKVSSSEEKSVWPEPALLYRLCFGGDTDTENNCSTGEEATNDESFEVKTNLLGIFDALVVRKEKNLYRTVLPRMEKKSTPFFTLQDRVYPVIFTEEKEEKTTIHKDICEKSNIVAVIAITVKRAAARLEVAERIFNVAKIERGDQSDPDHIYQLKGFFEPKQDMMYLCEGRDDLLLVFSIPKTGALGKDKLDNIIAIQNCIYQDFQVSRTETLLAASCFDLARQHPESFTTEIRVRLLEDRSLSPANKSYVNATHESLKELDNTSDENFTITKITGRMDFKIELGKGFPKSTYEEVIGAVKNKYVDKLLTNIGVIEKPPC